MLERAITKQLEAAKEQRVIRCYFVLRSRKNPGFLRGDEISLAVNFREKQRKQGKPPVSGITPTAWARGSRCETRIAADKGTAQAMWFPCNQIDPD